MLDDDLLQSFMTTFHGYGTYEAPYWFVGMEERGATTVEDIQSRLETWDRRGRRELEGLAAYHLALGQGRLFQDKPPLQPTWNRLIRIVLGAENEKATLPKIRRYQRRRLGRIDGETCLTELLPLPAPSTGDWPYARISRLPYLQDRERYREAIAPKRMAHLRRRIREYAPRAVVFYSLTYRSWWQKIASVRFERVDEQAVYVGRDEGTQYVICRHPVAFGVSNATFRQIGERIGGRANAAHDRAP